MDVRELIKWLFQVKPIKTKCDSSRSSMPVLLRTLVISSVICMCKCEITVGRSNNVNNVSVRNVTENENKTAQILSVANDSKSENSVTMDDETRGEFRPVYGVLRKLRDWNKFLDGKSEEYLGKETARTFGRPIKKLQAMMIPLMFKMGVLSTLIVLTFLLALKGVAIGKMLLMLSGASLLASLSKIFLLKGHSGHEDISKQVHLHVHNSGYQHSGAWSSPSYGYSSIPTTGHEGWSRRQEPYLTQDNQNFFHQTGAGASVINTPYGRYVRTGAPTGLGYKR